MTTTTMTMKLQTYYYLPNLRMNTMSSITQESMIQYMFRVRMIGNTYNFKGILSTTCTTWILARQKWMATVILAL